MMEWLPIETAPKSNRYILLHGDGSAISDCTYVGSWDSEDSRWIIMGGYGEYLEPYFWMPLPAPPITPPEVK